MKIIYILLISISVVGGAHSICRAGEPINDQQAEGDVIIGGIIGKFRNTWYYQVLESDYASAPKKAALLTMDDRVLANVADRFRFNIDIEGSGLLENGKIVTYAGFKNGSTRYQYSQDAYGNGVGTCALVPYHTVAVDPMQIPLGTLIQIDETVGMVLPDKTIHDGLWRAEDVGSAIKGDRIDLFVGRGKIGGKILEQAGITNLKPLTVRVIEKTPTDSCTHK